MYHTVPQHSAAFDAEGIFSVFSWLILLVHIVFPCYNKEKQNDLSGALGHANGRTIF